MEIQSLTRWNVERRLSGDRKVAALMCRSEEVSKLEDLLRVISDIINEPECGEFGREIYLSIKEYQKSR